MRFINRVIAGTLTLALAGVISVVPCVAAEKSPPATSGKSLASITPAGMRVLMKGDAPVKRQDTGGPGSFMRTRKGKIAVVLVAAATGLTLWSVSHDRKPVKSPIR